MSHIISLHKLYILLLFICCLKVGVGMSMEGIEQNPIVYDLMSEMAFHHEKVNVKVIMKNRDTKFLNLFHLWF